jgi:hypothetical protein
VFTRNLQWSLARARSIWSIPPRSSPPPTYVFVFTVDSFHLAFPLITYMHIYSPHSCYTYSPSHPSCLDLIIPGEEYKFSLRSFLTLPSLHPPCTLLSNTFRLCSSLNAGDQVLYTYTTTRKVIVLNILTFTFSDRR